MVKREGEVMICYIMIWTHNKHHNSHHTLRLYLTSPAHKSQWNLILKLFCFRKRRSENLEEIRWWSEDQQVSRIDLLIINIGNGVCYLWLCYVLLFALVALFYLKLIDPTSICSCPFRISLPKNLRLHSFSLLAIVFLLISSGMPFSGWVSQYFILLELIL